jgi:hypothetical protein
VLHFQTPRVPSRLLVDLLNAFLELFVLECLVAFWAFQPGVIPAFSDTKYVEHGLQPVFCEIVLDELVFHLLSFAKYLAAAFKISRSCDPARQ